MKKCPYCADQIDEAANFCVFCGKKQTIATAIRIIRLGVFYGMLVKMNIHIDGEIKGRISYAKEITIFVNPGKHNIQVSTEWIKSKNYEVMVKEGQVFGLECGVPRGSIPKMMTFFSPNEVIYLQEHDFYKEKKQ